MQRGAHRGIAVAAFAMTMGAVALEQLRGSTGIGLQDARRAAFTLRPDKRPGGRRTSRRGNQRSRNQPREQQQCKGHRRKHELAQAGACAFADPSYL
jgi:hypothetical protein